MSLIQHLLLYLLTVPIFLAIDLAWLGLVARGLYRRELAGFLGPVNWGAAIGFYLLYVVAILVFAVQPGLRAGSLGRAVILGAFLGLVAYATYDLTNLATLKGWPVKIVIVDMIWGAVLTGSVAAASFLVARHLVLRP